MPFDWNQNNENDHILEGFDTDPTPSQDVSQMIDGATSIGAGSMEAVINSVNEVTKEEMTEVEWRLAKAQFYKGILENQLIASDHPAAIEVEQELQAWAQTQLEVLMGMKAQQKVQTPAAPLFSQQEVDVLKALANKVMNRPAQPVIQPSQPPKPQQVAPVVSQQPVTINQTPSMPVKRGRGRPRKYPRPEEAQVQPQAQPAKVSKSEEKRNIEVAPDGSRIEIIGNKRYKLINKEVINPDGTRGMREIKMDITPREMPATRVPYPSEEAVAMQAAMEAQGNLRAVSAHPELAKAFQASMTKGE